MAKSKHGRALFDLLIDDERESAEALKVPRWWGREEGKPRSGVTGGAGGRLNFAPTPSPKGLGGPSTVTTAEYPAGPSLEMDGDRIRVTFTSVTLAAAIFAVLIALIGVFALGRYVGDGRGFARGFETGRASYAADAMSEIEAARRQPPSTNLIGSLLEEPPPAPQPASQTGIPTPPTESPSATKPPAGVRWIPEHTYVVAQEFSAGRRGDATKAKAFLAERGIDTELIELPSGASQLITTMGFDREDPAQRRLADELLKKVHAAGAAYFADAGGYKLEGYFKKLKGETW